MRAGEVFEPEVVEIAKRFIKPGTVVLDVGSNFGQMAILFGGIAGNDGLVYAIEAQKTVYDILVRNVMANRAKNVTPVFKAAYYKSGETFYFPPPDFVRFGSYGSYNLPLDAKEGDPVKSLRIDDLTIDKPVSFMKVDVQGCDLFAMQGAVETIARHQMPILFEFEQRFQNEYGTRFQDYVDFVASLGYEFTETVLDINYLIQPRPSKADPCQNWACGLPWGVFTRGGAPLLAAAVCPHPFWRQATRALRRCSLKRGDVRIAALVAPQKRRRQLSSRGTQSIQRQALGVPQDLQ